MAHVSIGQIWSPQDLQQFQQVIGVLRQPVTELDHNGLHSSSCTGPDAQCGEVKLDVQQLSGMSRSTFERSRSLRCRGPC